MSDNQDALLALADRIDEANERPIVIHKGAATELRRLVSENEALRGELAEQARVNGMGGEREARLLVVNAELVEALRVARAEFDGLPHSLGYAFTHIPKIDAALAKVEAGK
jgi:hypothetical protein